MAFLRRDVWKSFTKVSGELSVMKVSIKQLQWLHVVNLVFVMVVQPFMDPLIGVWRQHGHPSTQQILLVQVTKKIYQIVQSIGNQGIVITTKMLESFVGCERKNLSSEEGSKVGYYRVAFRIQSNIFIQHFQQ